MIYGLYHSAAGMMTNEYRQSVTANNLANADTVGFKRDIATLMERQPASEAGVRRGPSNPDLASLSGGLWLGQTYTSFDEGAFISTGNYSDIALDGDGFLMVEQDGETLLTRDGRLVMDQDGRLLAASDGAQVLGQGGAPLQLNPRGGEFSIDENGRIQQDGATVGQLALTGVNDYTQLTKTGASRFKFEQNNLTETYTQIRQGVVENSSVEPLKELVSMIEASRAYQINAQMVSLQDQTVARLLNVVTA